MLISGDNLLCSGEGKFPLAIKLFNRTNADMEALRAAFTEEQIEIILSITHVAKVAKGDGETYVFESTVENKWCEAGPKRGIQINPYDLWLENYGGKVWHQPVRPIAPRDQNINLKRARIQRRKMYGLPYESGINGLVELMGAFDEGMANPAFDNKARTSNVFCGETVAIQDQVCGILDMQRPCNKYAPMKFVDGTYQDHLIGCKAMELVRLK